MLQLVSQNGINVEYMYSLIQRNQPQAIMIFRFDKIDMAIELLEKHNFRILSTDQLF